MATFFYDVFVAWDEEPEAFLDRYEDLLFEAFEGDVTPGVQAGIPYVGGHSETDSIEKMLEGHSMLSRVLHFLAGEGLRVQRIEVELEAEAVEA